MESEAARSTAVPVAAGATARVRRPKRAAAEVAPNYAEIRGDGNTSSSDNSSDASPEIVTGPRRGCRNGARGGRGNARGSRRGGRVGRSTVTHGRGISGGRGRAVPSMISGRGRGADHDTPSEPKLHLNIELDNESDSKECNSSDVSLVSSAEPLNSVNPLMMTWKISIESQATLLNASADLVLDLAAI